MQSRYYLGVDGGQSSTTALIADEEGRVVGRGKGGPCNHARAAEGRAKFISAMGGCLQEACHQAGLDSAGISFASVCLGFSGGAEDKDQYARELIRSEKYKITHDAEIALSGAVPDEAGIIAIAGTGSMVFGRNHRGETARAGGWGYIYGDEGGAFDLTRRALRAALEYEEGWGPTTDLHRMLLEAAGAENANQLLHSFYGGIPRSTIAAYAPVVTEAALGGDPVARTILDEAAAGLTRYVHGAYNRLFSAREVVQICYIGAAFRSEPLLNSFKEQIAASIHCQVAPPRFSPVTGALLEALRADGNPNTPFNLPENEK
jgi:N-acetylglucosamine kinase-like BadF-type ATPase